MNRSLVKDTWIYGFGSILTRMLGVVLIPLYTRYLDVDAYGALALLNIIAQNVSFICLLGVSTAAMRAFFDPGADTTHRQQVYGTATVLLTVFPPVALLILGPVTWLLTTQFVPSLQFFPLVFVVLLTGLFSPLIKLMVGLLRVQRKPLAYVTFQLSFFLLQTGAIIVALAGLGYGLRGQIYSQLLTNGVFAVVAFIILRRFSPPNLSWPRARLLLADGIPLVAFFIFIWIYEASPRFMLEHFVDLRSVGLFALAGQFSGILLLASTSLDNVMLPHFLERAGQPGGGRALGITVQHYLTFLGLLGLMVIIAGSPAIQLLTTPRYHEAVQYVTPLVLAGWLYAARAPVTWSLNHSRRSGLLAVVNGIAVAVMIGLLFLFLGTLRLGIMGVIYAMLGAGIVSVAVGYAVANRAFRLEIPRKRLASIVALMLAAGVLIAALTPERPDVIAIAVQSLVFFGVAVATLRISGIRNPLRLIPGN